MGHHLQALARQHAFISVPVTESCESDADILPQGLMVGGFNFGAALDACN